MNTRISNDPIRRIADNEYMTFESRYQLNTPGNGIHMAYDEDVYCNLQKWGANLQNNTTDLESEFMGITKPLSKYDDQIPLSTKTTTFINPYPTRQPFTQESRTLCPAWMLRGIHIDRTEYPFQDPQANTELPFPTMMNTTMIAKDTYIPKPQEIAPSGFNEIGEYLSLTQPKNVASNSTPFYSNYAPNYQQPQTIDLLPGASRWHMS